MQAATAPARTHAKSSPRTTRAHAQYGEFRVGYAKDAADTRCVYYGIRYLVENYLSKQWTLEDVEQADLFYRCGPCACGLAAGGGPPPQGHHALVNGPDGGPAAAYVAAADSTQDGRTTRCAAHTAPHLQDAHGSPVLGVPLPTAAL